MKLTTLLGFLAMFAAPLYAQSPPKGIWLSPAEIGTLPMTGTAWEAMKKEALVDPWATPDLSNQDSRANVQVLAGAFYAVRTGSVSMRDRVRAAVARIPETENGGRTLALGRELAAYVIAIDLVGWDTAAKETAFKAWLSKVRTETLDGKTLISTQETRPNNWGTQAGFSRVVAAIYLSDTADLARAAVVFRGWMGDRAAYAKFVYGDLDWHADPTKPVGINPKGSTIGGHNVDGVQPEEMRRTGSFEWPPPISDSNFNYEYTGLAGALCEAWVLQRWGYPDVWTWSDGALGRAYRWIILEAKSTPTGNDLWQPWMINAATGTTWKTVSPAPISREIGWVDWTHAKPWGPPPPPPPPPPEEDFMLSFNFQFLEETKTWSVNVNPTNGFKAGTGATPSEALNDFTIKNPGL